MKTLIKAAIIGTVAAGTFEVLRRTKVLEKAADLITEKMIHIAVNDRTPDEGVEHVAMDGMYR